MRPDNLFALDFGTTKFSFASLKAQEDKTSFEIKTVSIAAKGMHRGMLSNVAEAEKCLSDLVDKAQKIFQMSIDRVVLGVSGSHLRSFTQQASIKIPKAIVTTDLLEILIQQIKKDALSAKREILHVIPLVYKIDDRPGIENPTGFSGELITGSFLVIDADLYYLKDMIKVCNNNGIEVAKLIAEPIASAAVTVDDTYKQVGAVLLDIGGGTADGIIYVGGRPIRLFTINIGGKLMTKDLSVGLNLAEAEAERVKQHFGLGDGTTLTVSSLSGENIDIASAEVYSILAPRIDEFSSILFNEIGSFRKMLGSGIILTGGGSEIDGLCHYLSQRLNVPVRKLLPRIITLPENVSELQNRLFAPQTELMGRNATVLGLLKHEVDHLVAKGELEFDIKTTSYMQRFFSWIKEMS